MKLLEQTKPIAMQCLPSCQSCCFFASFTEPFPLKLIKSLRLHFNLSYYVSKDQKERKEKDAMAYFCKRKSLPWEKYEKIETSKRIAGEDEVEIVKERRGLQIHGPVDLLVDKKRNSPSYN